MMQSAIEKEIHKHFQTAGAWLRSHDRGVLLAFFLAIPPFPPLPIFGLVLSLLNFWLWKTQRLDASEGRLIKVTIFLSIVMTCVGVFVAAQVFSMLKLLPEYVPTWIGFFQSAVDFFRGLLHAGPSSITTIRT